MKKSIYIGLVILLAITSIYYFQRTRTLSRRLSLIEERIEESRKRDEAAGRILGKVAIVLDDWGYNQRHLDKIWELDVPITLAILPNLPYSKAIAKEAYARSCEVILHLPLEPHEERRLEENTITSSLTDEEILRYLDNAISEIPNLSGISNHMGSKATEDERVMSLIFGRMKEDDLYFLDSLVTDKSICGPLSRANGVRFIKRSVFLDNEPELEYIKGQLRELASRARAMSSAIGIGHNKALTIQAIEEMMPEFKEMNVNIVTLSELIEE